MAVRVVPMEIKSSATQLDNCAITVRRHLPTEIARVAQALPSSRSGPKATKLRSTWRKRFRGWSQRADTQVVALRRSATTWSATDQVSASRAEKIARQLEV